MATTYTAGGAASGVISRTSIPGVVSELVTYSLTATPVINDVFEMLKLPANAQLIDIILDVGDLDTTTGIVLSAGTSAFPALFISGATIGRSGAGGIQHANVAGTVNYTPTTEQTLVIKVTTAPTAGNSTSSLTLAAIYTMSANSVS